jgi:hypothetical protein
MTLIEEMALAMKKTPSLNGAFVDHEGMAKAAAEVLERRLLSDEAVSAASDRFLDCAFFSEQGQNDIAYIPLGDTEIKIEHVIKAAIQAAKGE